MNVLYYATNHLLPDCNPMLYMSYDQNWKDVIEDWRSVERKMSKTVKRLKLTSLLKITSTGQPKRTPIFHWFRNKTKLVTQVQIIISLVRDEIM